MAKVKQWCKIMCCDVISKGWIYMVKRNYNYFLNSTAFGSNEVDNEVVMK
jgi:expansin (peptidoglycan-binding protein)